ncbi:MAG: TIGR03619 family F420-dependent LLM class oxidoreductase [Actinomycetia bacterium]|nr:TIGR03619 family F420-dependent LLM class oxidoreductase [Actinomycetes bacterium]MCP4226184.1 TIGR03619 family F420-dependent LLM class oxidoreductase [Actinomycetes bacterium]MCP5034430.1 TIGR03619 family F420-dependent LLM class oxidoreductase [Actinomycetes bacterium]
MKLGINLINFGPAASPDLLAGWAELAESLGYHSLLTSDHVAITPDVTERYPAPFYEPISTLGWLAGITERIEIGTTVTIVPYRHPLQTARAFANIDQLSGGRLIFGVGVGWATREFEALDVPFARRGALTDEYLDVIIRHWTDDEVSHDGTHHFEGVDTSPRPVRRPHPPIWVGGGSDAALRRTIRLGAAWHPIRQRPEQFRDRSIPHLRALAEAADRQMPELCPRIQFDIRERPLPEGERLLGEGTFEQLRADLALLEELGCSHVILDSFNAAWQDASATLAYERIWERYRTVAGEVFDLDAGTVR